MTTSEYENLTPREATPSRLFAFYKNGSTRFYPGDGARLHFANRDVDTLELPGVPSGYLAAGDVVTATYKGVCVFRGDVATIVESRGRGSDATQTVTCVGPWSKMARLVYRQYWNTGSGYELSSRLILNQYKDGSSQNLNSELIEIAQHGASPCGYTRGTVSVSTQHLPFDECRDITVADAIKRELRFFPKAITRFDYSTATPTLNITKGTATSTASYVDDIPKSAREYVYNAHPITGVDLEIEATGEIQGVTYHNIDHQKAGDTTAGNPDCLYATLQIKGASSNTTHQSFTSVTEDIPDDLNDVSWWKAKHPRLANVASDAIKISDAARTGTLPRISAATAGELKEAGLSCEVSQFRCNATITTTDDKEEEIVLTMNFLTTNAEGTADKPKTYTWIASSSSESGETVPSGLARTLLEERAGKLLSERLTIRLGDSLPQLGDAIVESDGTVYLQSFDIDCGALTADLNFGVPDYLSPEDMASLLSGFRNKCTASSSSVRKTGEVSSEGVNVELGAIPPLSSTEFAPGTKAKTTIASSGNSASNAFAFDATGDEPQLDVKKVDVSKTLKLHKLTYSDEDGNPVEAYGLFDDDIDLTDMEPPERNLIEGAQASAFDGDPGGLTVTFYYTDGTNDTIIIYNGKDGEQGAQGEAGETPEITADKNGDETYIYADGEVIATIKDGETPVIDATKSGKVTTITADGRAIAQILDGDDSSGTSVPSFTFVSDVTWNGSQIVISKKQWNGTAIVNATGSTIATTPIS